MILKLFNFLALRGRTRDAAADTGLPLECRGFSRSQLRDVLGDFAHCVPCVEQRERALRDSQRRIRFPL